jgi:hypothetical protein
LNEVPAGRGKLKIATSSDRPSSEQQVDPGKDERRLGERCEQRQVSQVFPAQEARELRFDEIELVEDRV